MVRQNFGSPAQHFGIRGMLITAVNEQPTPDIDAFIEAVKDFKDRESVRLQVKDIRGSTRVITLTLNDTYWPMAEIRRDEGQWQRVPL